MTPPKLMPPFHSTAASGTLPMEHTKDRTATSGPTKGPQKSASVGWPTRKKPCQKLCGYPGCECATDEQAAADIEPKGVPVHVEIVGDGGQALWRRDFLRQRALVQAHVHGGMAFHLAGQVAVGLPACRLNDAWRDGGSQHEHEQGDHDGAADELRQHELPSRAAPRAAR